MGKLGNNVEHVSLNALKWKYQYNIVECGDNRADVNTYSFACKFH